MKRYDFMPEAFSDSSMVESPTGDYIRADDPDLAALVAAADTLMHQAKRDIGYPEQTRGMRDAIAAISAALNAFSAAVAASGTTRKGGGE